MERFPQKQGVGMKCRDFLVTNGVVLRAVGDTIIGAPPFILSHAEADELVDKAWLGLELTRKAVAD
jgi:putrescine aminotransferase